MTCEEHTKKANQIANQNGAASPKLRTGIISFSQIAQNRYHSLAAEDYLPDDDYIKILLLSPHKSDAERLAEMLKNKIITQDDLERVQTSLLQQKQKENLEYTKKVLVNKGQIEAAGSDTTQELNVQRATKKQLAKFKAARAAFDLEAESQKTNKIIAQAQLDAMDSIIADLEEVVAKFSPASKNNQ